MSGYAQVRSGTGLAFACVIVAVVACGQRAHADGPDKRSIDRLVRGDWYAIDVCHDGVRQRFEGDFLKTNDAWIVLRRISESRNDVAVSTSAKALTKKQGTQPQIAQKTEYLWIPREAATIAGRVVAVKPCVAADVGESPALNAVCLVVAAKEDATEETGGRLIELTDEQAVVRQDLRFYTKPAVPYVGELPFVGALFRNVVGTDEVRRIEVPRAAVMCIRVTEAQSDAPPIETARRP